VASARRHSAPLVHENSVNALAFSPDGKLLATACNGGPTRLWDLGSGRPVGPAFRPGHTVRRLSFRPDGKVLAIGSETDGNAYFVPVPGSIKGDLGHLRVWVEVLTGMELTEGDIILPLSPEALAERRRQLRALHGPPERPRVDD
jgi:WD40 repeat protein